VVRTYDHHHSATLSRLPKQHRRHTVDGTTSTRLRTQVSGETSSECVATASVTGRRLTTVLKLVGPDHPLQTQSAECRLWLAMSGLGRSRIAGLTGAS
jgi:hypothetical protein